MTEQSPQSQLDELRQMIAGMRKQADNLAFKAALDELLAQEAALVAQIEGGERSAVGSTAEGDIIPGDNNQTGGTQIDTVEGDISGQIAGRDNITVNRILNLYLSQGGDQTDEETLRSQITSYLIWMRDQHSTIELRGIKREGQQVVQLDLETVYVPLAARALGQTRREVALDQVLGQGRRVAITGGPGSGKTTVLLHLAWTLTEALLTDDPALAKTKFGFTGDLPLPIFVPLSRYARHLRDLPAGASPEDKTLAGFISRYLIEKQANLTLASDFFTQLLRQDQAVILLLDGLDEVPNERERVQVREAIEDLVTGRDKMPVVVTCRTAAYQGRTALGKGFGEVQVLPLDAAHLGALIRQAYKHLYRSDPSSAQTKADELLAGITKLEADRRDRFGDEVEPLVTSPLMVRMLLVVHYSERRLPDQRAELFMKATDAMLLPEHAPDEAVAEEIGSLVGGSREVHRELVQYLAFKMHERGEAQGRDIDEDSLREILAGESSFAELIEDFTALTRLRGTVLEERLGTYRFIHLAFQEYLAARYLAEIIRGVEEISAYLEAGPILDSWWREVALLTVGYLSVTSPQIAQRLLLRWAGLDDNADQRKKVQSTEVLVAMAEVAGVAAQEWPGISDGVRVRIAERIAGFFAQPDWFVEAPPIRRAAAGRALAGLGDPRVGVTTLAGMEFCYVPKGPFWMGSPDKDEFAEDNEKPLRMVNLDYDYWLARYPVTMAQFRDFVEQYKYEELVKYSLTIESNCPAVPTSWEEALVFCKWLTDYWHLRDLLPSDLCIHLPSEAEREKGARGGFEVPSNPYIVSVEQLKKDPRNSMIANVASLRRYPWLSNVADPNCANYVATGIKNFSAVGCFPTGASPYGIEDMSGNVWEWCRGSSQDSIGHFQTESYTKQASRRVWRGGSWRSEYSNIRCAKRTGIAVPNTFLMNYGFRLVITPLPLRSVYTDA